MNKDQVKGSIKEAAGKVQQKAGEILGINLQKKRRMTGLSSWTRV